ncbi:MAG: sensor histidine kinase [Chloroflexota bacterium]
MIAAPLVVLGLLLVLSSLLGNRIAGRERGAVTSFLLSPFDPRAMSATGAILAGFFVEIVAVTIVGTLFSVGTSLLVVGIGIVPIGAGVEVARRLARNERRRLSGPGDRPLLAHPYRPRGTGIRELAMAIFLDINRWRDVLYLFVAFPLVVLEATFVAVLWLAAILLISLPIWVGSIGAIGSVGPLGPIGAGATWPSTTVAGAFVLGVVLLPVAASVARGLFFLHRAVVSGLLCESEQRALERRVETLEVSRKTVIDVEANELRRIERDLHDGAQQRLVMLAMDLSLAADKMDADPEQARRLVVEAQSQARQALAELRDLVRGIAPGILVDRGLVPAVAALAGRSSVPTTIASTLPDGERLPDAIERAAYYVIAESLTNVAKHSGAARCEVALRLVGRSLVVEVRDDGAGGAQLVPAGGLAGLAGRVEALDGRLTVESPVGGPTVVRAEFPIGATPPRLDAASSPDAVASQDAALRADAAPQAPR